MARDNSDVDIFIEAQQADRFNAFDLIDVKTLLERRLDAHVDLTTRDGLHPRLREQIERESVRVF
jgi:predicted nucleotidyltransferase